MLNRKKQANPQMYSYPFLKFHDFTKYFLGYDRHMLKIAKFRTITRQIINKIHKYPLPLPDTQLHMLTEISVKFHDLMSNIFELRVM
jgi:hypothetical protein